MRNVVCIQKMQQVRDALMLRDPQQVGGATDTERRQLRKLCSWPQLDAEFGKTCDDPWIVNVHVAPDAPDAPFLEER